MGERPAAERTEDADGVASQPQTPQWLEAENRILRAPGAPDSIASAQSMRPVLEMMARLGPSDANVLISGKHGTGKEVVAQTLHRLPDLSIQTYRPGGLLPV